MPKPCRFPALLLFLSLVAIHLAHAADKVSFVQHWEPGKVYHYEASYVREEFSGPDRKVSQSATIGAQLDFTVTREGASGSKLVEVKYVSAKVLEESDGEIATYDSSNPAGSDPDLQEEFEMIGKSYTMVFDKDDTFEKVIIPDDFPEDGALVAENTLDDLGVKLPPQPVAPGESFEYDHAIEEADVFRLKGRYDSVAEKDGRKEAKLLMEGIPANEDAEAKVTRETLFDLGRRCVTRNTLRIETRPNGNPAANQTQELRITTLKGVDDIKAVEPKAAPKPQ